MSLDLFSICSVFSVHSIAGANHANTLNLLSRVGQSLASPMWLVHRRLGLFCERFLYFLL